MNRWRRLHFSASSISVLTSSSVAYQTMNRARRFRTSDRCSAARENGRSDCESVRFRLVPAENPIANENLDEDGGAQG
jgi:hypothetical protein